MNGDGSSLRAVFPRQNRSRVKQVRMSTERRGRRSGPTQTVRFRARTRDTVAAADIRYRRRIAGTDSRKSCQSRFPLTTAQTNLRSISARQISFKEPAKKNVGTHPRIRYGSGFIRFLTSGRGIPKTDT